MFDFYINGFSSPVQLLAPTSAETGLSTGTGAPSKVHVRLSEKENSTFLSFSRDVGSHCARMIHRRTMDAEFIQGIGAGSLAKA